MGRALIEKTINDGNNHEYKNTVSHSYNLDGSLATLTYPSGNVVTYTVGAAGRVTQVSDPSNDYVYYSSTSGLPEYSPQGEVANIVNGYITSSGAGIVTSNVYNDRLQPILLSASVGSTSVYSLCYDFHLGVAINSGPCALNKNTTGDNGNVSQVLDHVDSTRSAMYQYDVLNRLSQAATVGNGTNCWAESYTINAWANLTGCGGVTGYTGCATEPLSASASTKNQLSILTYHAAGNVTNDGNGNQPIYDAENRITRDASVNYYYDADRFRMEKDSGTLLACRSVPDSVVL